MTQQLNLPHDDVRLLVEALSARDPHTGEHVNRVACIATEMALIAGLRGRDLVPVEIGARLHDIGKLEIPDHILLKPAGLNDEEWAVMRRHPSIGADILRPLPSLASIAPAVEAHHERWDGAGYPHGLRGEAIPQAARIFAIADSIDAMASDRPYRKGLAWDRIRAELMAGDGTQWEPRLTIATVEALDRIEGLVSGCPHAGIVIP